MLLRPPTRLGVLGLGLQDCTVEGFAVQSEAARPEATRHATVVCLLSSPHLTVFLPYNNSFYWYLLRFVATKLRCTEGASVVFGAAGVSAKIRAAVSLLSLMLGAKSEGLQLRHWREVQRFRFCSLKVLE